MPEDRTPHGGESMHELPDRAKIPSPKPDAQDERTRWPLPQNSEYEGDNAPPAPREPERKP